MLPPTPLLLFPDFIFPPHPLHFPTPSPPSISLPRPPSFFLLHSPSFLFPGPLLSISHCPPHNEFRFPYFLFRDLKFEVWPSYRKRQTPLCCFKLASWRYLGLRFAGGSTDELWQISSKTMKPCQSFSASKCLKVNSFAVGTTVFTENSGYVIPVLMCLCFSGGNFFLVRARAFWILDYLNWAI